MLPSPASLQKRFHPSQDPPQWFKDYWGQGGASTAAGVSVGPDVAMRVTAALACIRIIADTEASLPFFTYRRLERGKEKATDHYLYPILHDIANPEMSAFTFRRTITAHVASRGNGLAEIEFDGGGRVRALWPLNPDKATIQRDPRSKKLFYTYELPESEGSQKIRLAAERVLHIKWLSHNGLWAMSPVQLMAESLGISIAAQEYMGRFFQNDASPRGVIEGPSFMKQEAYDRLKESWYEDHGGLSNTHRMAILEEGFKFNPISLSPQDMMLLDLMRFGVEDVGRVWGISSDMLNLADKAATYASVEQFGIRFATHTVRPWVVNWEQECQRTLLTESERKEYFVEHNLDGLLRGDFKTRVEGYASGINAGWMSRNEPREFENLNPRDGLDEMLVPMNMQASNPDPTPDPSPFSKIENGEGKAPNARDVMTPIYTDIFQRIQRREMHDHVAAEKKHKDQARFIEWRQAYYSDLEAEIALQISPALKAHAALRGTALSDVDLQALARRSAREYCEDALKHGGVDTLFRTDGWIEIFANGVTGLDGAFAKENHETTN